MIVLATYDADFQLHQIQTLPSRASLYRHLYQVYEQLTADRQQVPEPFTDFSRKPVLEVLELLHGLNPAISREFIFI